MGHPNSFYISKIEKLTKTVDQFVCILLYTIEYSITNMVGLLNVYGLDRDLKSHLVTRTNVNSRLINTCLSLELRSHCWVNQVGVQNYDELHNNIRNYILTTLLLIIRMMNIVLVFSKPKHFYGLFKILFSCFYLIFLKNVLVISTWTGTSAQRRVPEFWNPNCYQTVWINDIVLGTYLFC